MGESSSAMSGAYRVTINEKTGTITTISPRVRVLLGLEEGDILKKVDGVLLCENFSRVSEALMKGASEKTSLVFLKHQKNFQVQRCSRL